MPSGPDPDRAARSATQAETQELLSSEEVNGTAVYTPQGEKLGAIHHLMIGRRDGRVIYAVLASAAGFGANESYYPLAWEALTYDSGQGGFVVDLGKSGLAKSSPLRSPHDPAWDREHGQDPSHYYPYLGGIA